MGCELDAYGSVLALDSRRGDQRMRRELVDVVGGEFRFNEQDLQQFETAYALQAPGGPAEPAVTDYSRHDLNGDGFTGGSRTARFDLDAGPLGPDGAPVYGRLQVDVEGTPVEFNEEALTDLDILKYFAYVTDPGGQPLYYDTSAPNALSERRRIFGGGSGLLNVQVLGGQNQLTTMVETLGACDVNNRPVFRNALIPEVQPAPMQLSAGSTRFEVSDGSSGVFTVRFSTSLPRPVDCPSTGPEPSLAFFETFLRITANRPGRLRVEKRRDLTTPPTVVLSDLTTLRPTLEERISFGVLADPAALNLSNFVVAAFTFTPSP